MKPMLAHTLEPNRLPNDLYWLQPKLNGVRALYQDGHFQSRDEIPWNEPVLRHLTQPLKLMFPDERTILDGELYVHGWPLQKINGAIAVNRAEPCEDTFQVEYHIFDVVSFNLPFEERFFEVMKYKKGLFTPDIKVRLVETVSTTHAADADDFYAMQVKKGYEGIMYRIGNCPYTHPKQPLTLVHWNGNNKHRKYLSDKQNRTWHLLKRKDWHDDEFKCIGMVMGEGKYVDMAGALVCLTHDNKSFYVGSGLTDEDRMKYFEQPPVNHMIKVKFLTYTSDGKPFNPTVLAVL
jgi:DNA ligase 1